MKTFLLIVVLIVSGCATRAANINPAQVSSSRYEGWTCEKLLTEQAYVEKSLAKVSADQNHAATMDIVTVALIGVPFSKGGPRQEVARLKGEQIAIHRALVDSNCNTVEQPQTQVPSSTVFDSPIARPASIKSSAFDGAWEFCKQTYTTVSIACLNNQGVKVARSDWEKCRILPEHKVSKQCVWEIVEPTTDN